MDLSYYLFMAEAENRFPDKRAAAIQQTIDDCVAAYRAGYNINNVFESILLKNNLTNASPREVERICVAVNSLI